MRHHKKQYENVFSTDVEKSITRLRVDKLSAEGMELNEYILLFQNFLKEFYDDLFFRCIKLSWMRRKFIFYDTKTILPMYRNSRWMNIAFVKLMRRNIGHDLQIITRGNFFTKLESYFNDFYPRFEEENPFKNPDYYKFPYKNLSLEYLVTVHRMDERLELLEEANKRKMSYAVFVDYVINHAYCENDFLGRMKYSFSSNNHGKECFVIENEDRKLRTKKDHKRKRS